MAIPASAQPRKQPLIGRGGLQLRYYVYVWEFPVRLFHWVNALCITVLCVTGYLMGQPLALASAAEASQQYWFGTVRFLHFATAYVWVAVALLRVYWGFVGNEYVRFKALIPLTRSQWREIGDVFRMDVLQIWKDSSRHIGHNAMAGLTYVVLFGAFLIMTVTGFGLYTAMSNNWFVDLFNWVVPLFGGEHLVRIIHHLMMWFFVFFVIVHVYLAAYHDYVEATGTISSMIGGWKFVRQRQATEDFAPVDLPEEPKAPEAPPQG